MGTWGPGLWQDDTASDVRTVYREAIEDGLTDFQARERVFAEFSMELADDEYAGVVWLALAAVQHSLGRLDSDVRGQALQLIDGGSDLLRWEGTKSEGRRRSALTKLRDRLSEPQPARKRVRRPPRRVTALVPGDVLAYRAPSEHYYLLAVHAVHANRYGSYPFVRLLDYDAEAMPDEGELATLGDRQKGSVSDRLWWKVDGVVMHMRGHDFADVGFVLAGHRPALPETEQEALVRSPSSFSGWEFWQGYLDDQDERLEQQRNGSRSS